MPHNGIHGAVAGANPGRKKGLLPRIPDISKPKAPPFPQAGRENSVSPKAAERENRKSMRSERKRPNETSF
jgi:hypothetical protein